ncbi:alpha-L-fucosidase [Flavihumibacter profundi]|uniref:alpha-L-fucosidase n=1 Tax=Flavihumibacter profundi TaxID=2716883 RepID=UPI001CC5F025|nr:alpha-L-fucosidase [Flavihumibacter profundi]MBZ5859556.1 alpha-L-fucosidase [Flavihumibacter profundi]
MKRVILLTGFTVACFLGSIAQKTPGEKPISTTGKDVIKGFMDKRFGMFIHWGPITLRGTEIGWSRGHEVPVEDYDNLYKEFNPVLFNADTWVKAAKDAGMKYITFTSKHHDGFCMWPSAFTQYDIQSTQYKKDIVGEIAKACKKQGIAFCLYFTILDWHDTNYPLHNLGDSIPDPKSNMGAFVQTMKNELTELVTNYHPYMIWFDGNWEEPWTKSYGQEIYTHLKRLDANLIINNRLGKGSHKVMSAASVGDYTTPEQEIGNLNMDTPWESCITICDQWAWKPNDKMKTLQECLQTLIKTASGNGNLLLNVGPMPDGRMEQRQVNQLKKIGDWLKIYGESIYGTAGGPYAPNDNYSATRKDTRVFIHIFNTANKEIVLPVLPGVKLLSAKLMNGPAVKVQAKDDNYYFTLPAQLPDNNSNVLVLQLDKQAIDLPIIDSK